MPLQDSHFPYDRHLPNPAWAALLFLAAAVLNYVLSYIFMQFSPDLAILLSEPLAILIPTLVAVQVLRVDVRATLRLRMPTITDLLLAVPLALSLTVLNDQLSALTNEVFPIPESLREGMARLLTADTPYEWAVRIVGLAVGAAASEEILFRGFIQTSLEHGALSKARAIWLTSFLFALMHGVPQGFPSYILAGLVLGFSALATGSILVPIVIHSINNASVVALLNLAGLETLGRPVWIPASILIPAVLLFTLTLSYYWKRSKEKRPEEAEGISGTMNAANDEDTESLLGGGSDEREPSGRFLASELPSAAPPTDLPTGRRRLGWLAVGCSVVGGTIVVLSLFSYSLLYAPQVRRHFIEPIKIGLLDAAPSRDGQLGRRIVESFDALTEFSDEGRLSVRQFLRVVWLYGELQSDGIITEPEIEAILAEVNAILHSGARVRRL